MVTGIQVNLAKYEHRERFLMKEVAIIRIQSLFAYQMAAN